MCGRYTVLTEKEIIEIREILNSLSIQIARDDFMEYKEAPGNETPGEVFPTNSAPVITKNKDTLFFESVKWGFTKWDSSGVIINARVETIKQKNTFAKHLESGRCVVPAGAFFEWEKTDKGKKKHYVKDKDGNLLFMAGLYRNVPDKQNPDEYNREFVIITKEATGEIAKIHDRMPVLLRVEQIEPWLTGALKPEDIKTIEFDVSMKPCEDKNTEEQMSLFD